MKLMPALPESIFDIGYLIFAILSGIKIIKTSKREVLLMGMLMLPKTVMYIWIICMFRAASE